MATSLNSRVVARCGTAGIGRQGIKGCEHTGKPAVRPAALHLPSTAVSSCSVGQSSAHSQTGSVPRRALLPALFNSKQHPPRAAEMKLSLASFLAPKRLASDFWTPPGRLASTPLPVQIRIAMHCYPSSVCVMSIQVLLLAKFRKAQSVASPGCDSSF